MFQAAIFLLGISDKSMISKRVAGGSTDSHGLVFCVFFSIQSVSLITQDQDVQLPVKKMVRRP